MRGPSTIATIGPERSRAATSIRHDHPSRSRTHLGLAGGLLVFTLTVCAASSTFDQSIGNFRVASFSVPALIGAFVGFAGWTLVLLYDRIPRAAASAAAGFALFGIPVVGSLIIDGATRQGVQFIVVLAAALGSLLLAATARRVAGRSLDFVVGRTLRLTALVLIAAAVAGSVSSIRLAPRPSAIVALVPLAWMLAEYRLGKRTALWWAIALLAGIALSLSRTALLAGSILVLVTLLAGSDRHRARNMAICVLLVCGGYWAVTSWAPLRDRFSQGDVSLSVGGLNVNAEGRTEVWSQLWSEIPDELVLGHGLGTASERSLRISTAFDHPHNDYLRVTYDLGVVGFAVLAWSVLRCTALLKRADPRHSVAARAALLGGLAILVMMATDNPLDYPFVMLPLAAVIGLGLGSSNSQSSDRKDPQPSTPGPDRRAVPASGRAN